VTSAPAPGWYPDPAGDDELFRWWDGGAWTSATSGVPLPSGPVGLGSSRPNGPPAPRPVEMRRPDPLPAHSASAVRVTMILASGFTLLVLAAVGAGLLLRRDPGSSVPAGRGAPLPSAAAARSSAVPLLGRLDESSRLASIGPASLTLPGAPYELSDDPLTVSGFDAFFVADAPVHGRYDGMHTWSAAVALAHLDPATGDVRGVDEAGPVVIGRLSRQMFDGYRTTVGSLSSTATSVDGHPGVLVTAEVRYRIAGLPSRFDRVSALVVELPDGSYVAAITSVPDDAEAGLSELASRSLYSLTVS
jgi:hypothetical protein